VFNSTEQEQVERLQKRDSLTREAAFQRVRAQMPLADKCQKADYVLDNSGDKETLKRQTTDLCIELEKITYKQRMLRPFVIFLFTIGLLYYCFAYFFLYNMSTLWWVVIGILNV